MILVYMLLAFYVLFMLFVLAMAFQRAWPKMSLFEKTLAAPVIVLGVLWDWLMNLTLVSAMFWELPWSKGELITARLKRYKHNPAYLDSRKHRVALVVCGSLDKFDPDGDHC